MAVQLLFSRNFFCFTLVLCVINFKHRTLAENVLCPSSCSCLGNFVDCSKRGLIDVPRDMPHWVQTLELQNNDYTSLRDDAFEGLVNLEKIDLGSNQLRSINASAFQHLTSLKELNLQHNYLTEIPDLGHHANLAVLSLHHNNIHSINSRALASLPALRVLDLHHNRLEEIVNGTFLSGTKLQQISLNSNRIFTLEDGCLGNLTNLETLKLGKNKLSKLPKDLFRQLKKLKTLDLSRNRIVQILSLTFKGLDSLKVLKLEHNRITSLLDGAFWELSSMEQLLLDYNGITVVARGWLYGLRSLKQLSLTRNNLGEIQNNTWEYCEKLSELDLSYNHLQVLRMGVFSRLPKLRYLTLEHNNISFIEDGAFTGLGSLETLKLNDNGISWTIEDMMGAFVGLDNLQQLSLSSNLIKSIAKHAFKGLDNLSSLDISNNSVTTIQNGSFAGMKPLKELQLDSSSLLCDCHLQWLPSWLSTMTFKDSVSATCAHPESLKGKSVLDVKAEDFTCGEDFPKPYFTEEPQTQISLKGDNVTLTCKAESSSTSEVSFQWKKDNKILHHASMENFATVSTGDIKVYTTILRLYNISNRDEGRYQCIISNHFGPSYSQKARITVLVFPTFTKTPTDVTVKTGSMARLECAAQGQPRPQISWHKWDGEDFPAAQERRIHVMPSDEVFFIVNVKLSDMGSYSCTAKNTAGVIEANFTLTVLEIPSFVKPMENKETRVGVTTVLECMATGSPKPKLTWSKDGTVLSDNKRHFFTADDQLLVIVETQPSDAGTYTCEMSNTLGTERGESRLTVVPKRPVDESMTGIIIIAVVCCIVLTSLVWVVIIYRTRKRHEEYLPTSTNDASLPSELVRYPPCIATCPDDYKGCTQHLFGDDNSEHSSKDSGTSDSAKRSNDNLIPSDLDVPGRSLLMVGGQRLVMATIADGDSLSSLKGHPSNSSVDTLSSSPSTQTTTSGGRPRGLSDPTFRTFLPHHTNHDRIANERLISSAAPCGVAPPKLSRGITPAEVTRWIPTSSSTSSSSAWQDQHKGLYTCPIDDRRSEGCVTTHSFSTFPRSSSSLSHKRNVTSSQLVRPCQEVQNDSGSFSIVSEDLQAPGHVVGCSDAGCSVPLGSTLNHSKCSLPNLTYVENTTPFYKSSFSKKDYNQSPCHV